MPVQASQPFAPRNGIQRLGPTLLFVGYVGYMASLNNAAPEERSISPFDEDFVCPKPLRTSAVRQARR